MHSAQIKPNPEIITQGKCHLCGKLDLQKHLHSKTKDANDILNSIYAACSDIMKQIIYFQFSFGYQLFLLEELTVQNILNTLKSKLQVSLKNIYKKSVRIHQKWCWCITTKNNNMPPKQAHTRLTHLHLNMLH